MAIPLTYDIAVNGEQRLRRVFRSISAEAKAHARTVEAAARPAPQRRRAAVASDQKERLRSITQLERAEQASAARIQRFRLAQLRRETREHRAGIREIEREQTAAARRVASARRTAERAASRTVTGAGRIVQNAGGRIVGAGKTALGIGTAIGGFAAVNAIQDVIETRAAASRLANQAGRPEIKGQLAKEATGLRGFTGTEALAGMEEFVTKTGDLDTARKLIGSLGRLSLATGSDLADLGATAGQVFNVVKDQGGGLKETIELMGVLAQQGALGAVEIRDLAQEFGKLGASTRSFEGGAPELIRTMGAFAQAAVARGGASSSADAATAASRLASDIVTNRKKFKRLNKGKGVDIKSKSDPTKLRNPLDIMIDVLEATGGDVEKTAGLFGLESRKIFQGYSPVFTEAEKKKKGSGAAAVRADFEKFFGAMSSPEQLKAREESRLADPDLLLKENLKKFNERVGTELLPIVTDKLVPALEKLTPKFAEAAEGAARLVDWFSQNPWTGLGAVVAGSLALEIGKAGIAAIVSSALKSLLMRGAVTTAIPAVAGSAAAGAAGATGAGIAGTSATLAGAGLASRFLAPTVLGASVGTAGVLGAGAAAAGGIMLADYSNDKLKETTGGMGIGDILAGMWDRGTFDPFAVVDAEQNRKAREQAAQREGHPGQMTEGMQAMNSQVQATAETFTALQESIRHAQAELDNIKGGSRRNDPILARAP